MPYEKVIYNLKLISYLAEGVQSNRNFLNVLVFSLKDVMILCSMIRVGYNPGGCASILVLYWAICQWSQGCWYHYHRWVHQCFSDRWYIHRRCLSGVGVSASSCSALQWHQCRCFQCFSVPVTLSHRCFSDISVGAFSVSVISGAEVIGVHWASVSVTKVSVLSVFTLTPHIPRFDSCR
jgi:hypothetical protein